MAAYWPYLSLPCGCQTYHKCPRCRLCRSCYGCDCPAPGAELVDDEAAAAAGEFGPPAARLRRAEPRKPLIDAFRRAH